MSRCAGVGRDYRNRDSQDDQWNITYYKCHAQFMNEVDRGRKLSAFWFSRTLNLLLARIQTFPEVHLFSGILWNLWISGESMLSAQELAADESLVGEKDCIVYSLVCIFTIVFSTIIISSSTISSISISFVDLLNCLYLSSWVSLLSICPPYATGGEGEGWVIDCLVLSCWLPG